MSEYDGMMRGVNDLTCDHCIGDHEEIYSGANSVDKNGVARQLKEPNSVCGAWRSAINQGC